MKITVDESQVYMVVAYVLYRWYEVSTMPMDGNKVEITFHDELRDDVELLLGKQSKCKKDNKDGEKNACKG